MNLVPSLLHGMSFLIVSFIYLYLVYLFMFLVGFAIKSKVAVGMHHVIQPNTHSSSVLPVEILKTCFLLSAYSSAVWNAASW